MGKQRVEKAREKFITEKRALLEKVNQEPVENDKSKSYDKCVTVKDWLEVFVQLDPVDSLTRGWYWFTRSAEQSSKDGQWYVGDLDEDTFPIAKLLGMIDQSAEDYFFVRDSIIQVNNLAQLLTGCERSIKSSQAILKRTTKPETRATHEQLLARLLRDKEKLDQEYTEMCEVTRSPHFPPTWKPEEHPISLEKVKQFCLVDYKRFL